jgi:hypothetical protein
VARLVVDWKSTDAQHDAACVEHCGVHIAVRDCVTDSE